MNHLSVAIITKNEEHNLPRTLASVKWADEVIVVDSGSTDRTVEIARRLGAKVFTEDWKGFSAQKNSALERCTGDWILSLDADEEVSAELAQEIRGVLAAPTRSGFYIPRKNFFLGKWVRHGGYYPDAKLRLFAQGRGRFEDRAVHETVSINGESGSLIHPLLHHAYPTLDSYIEHMNRYSSLGAELAIEKGDSGRNIFAFLAHVVVRPKLTFFYNYFLRGGFLDGREGLLLHFYHAVYVSWKYAKAWEKTRKT